MKKLNEILVGSLALSEPESRIEFLIDKINNSVDPPRVASAENVNIRAMYIVNDKVNSHGGRFATPDLDTLRRKIVDTPVLIGHNRASEPLARNFHAELESDGETTWLKSYFYWPKTSDGETDSLLEKIDSGVLKECSISFTYSFPECSECGQDIRTCPHDLGRSGSAVENTTHFIYRGISEILETSLVYKGSVKGTRLTDKLSDREIDTVSIRRGAEFVSLSLAKISPENSMFQLIPLGELTEVESRVVSAPFDTLCAIARKSSREYLLVKRSA